MQYVVMMKSIQLNLDKNMIHKLINGVYLDSENTINKVVLEDDIKIDLFIDFLVGVT